MIELLWVSDAKEAQGNVRGALCYGKDGLAGKPKYLLSEFAYALPSPRIVNHRLRRGNIGQRTYPPPFSGYRRGGS